MGTTTARLGFHYYPDDRHFTEADLHSWLPTFQALKAGWLVLRGSSNRAVPEFFIHALQAKGIDPIIHIPARIGALKLDEISPLLNAYASWGVRYVVLYDRPNMRFSWDGENWARRGLVERFLDHALPVLEAVRAVGLRPVLPPLEPGGDYWDTAFLAATLSSLVRRGHHTLLQDLTLGCYAWTFDRSLDWGAGGPARWKTSLPYATPLDAEDQLGFQIFDWYAAISRSSAGLILPNLVLAGGAGPRANPAAVERSAANCEIARRFAEGQVPAHVLNMAFYLLACEPQDPHAHLAWFNSARAPRPLAGPFFQTDETHFGPALPGSQSKSSDWQFEHYVLLPQTLISELDAQLTSIEQLSPGARPAVGYSPHEARRARTVTLVGGAQAFPSALLDDLRRAGCQLVISNDLLQAAAPIESHLAPEPGVSHAH